MNVRRRLIHMQMCREDMKIRISLLKSIRISSTGVTSEIKGYINHSWLGLPFLQQVMANAFEMPLRHLRQFLSCDDSFDDSAMDVEHVADTSEDGKNQHNFQYLFHVLPPVFSHLFSLFLMFQSYQFASAWSTDYTSCTWNICRWHSKSRAWARPSMIHYSPLSSCYTGSS